MKILKLSIFSILVGLQFGCPGGGGSGPVPIPVPSSFPTSATICESYDFQYTTPATITNYKVPDWLDLDLSNNTLSGEPEGEDFGNFLVWVEGQYQGKTGRVTARISVAAPKITFSPPQGVDIEIAKQYGNVKVEVAPDCEYNVELFTLSNSPQHQTFSTNPSVTTDEYGEVTIIVQANTDVPATGLLTLKITPDPEGGASPVILRIPINAHH
ncbi:MAG: hypothetical protein JSV88_06770 [Candidatus Aminicenantes bacterium]|nr:MAG: hypothetical protein JSV88_06770 [Candidatus Aminicenantes bacterium]